MILEDDAPASGVFLAFLFSENMNLKKKKFF